MGSRFGAANPRRAKNRQLKIMLSSIVFLLVILLLVLIWVLQTQQIVMGAEPIIANVVQPEASKTPVLIPHFRIETGTKLTNEMFKTVYLPMAEVPPNAILANQNDLVIDKYASHLVNANIAITKDDVTDIEPFDILQIPVGYRLITIMVDNRSGVDGFAKAGARVDVLWTFIQNGEKKISTIARFVKVVSLAGDPSIKSENARVQVAENKKVTTSLLVTEKQAKYLELARSTGELSLILLGGDNVPTDIDAEPEIISESGIKGSPKAEIQEPEANGKMIIGNKTYILRQNKWKEERSS